MPTKFILIKMLNKWNFSTSKSTELILLFHVDVSHCWKWQSSECHQAQNALKQTNRSNPPIAWIKMHFTIAVWIIRWIKRFTIAGRLWLQELVQNLRSRAELDVGWLNVPWCVIFIFLKVVMTKELIFHLFFFFFFRRNRAL